MYFNDKAELEETLGFALTDEIYDSGYFNPGQDHPDYGAFESHFSIPQSDLRWVGEVFRA